MRSSNNVKHRRTLGTDLSLLLPSKGLKQKLTYGLKSKKKLYCFFGICYCCHNSANFNEMPASHRKAQVIESLTLQLSH